MRAKEFDEIKKTLKRRRAALIAAEKHHDENIRNEAENRHGDSLDIAEADYEQARSFYLKGRTQEEIRSIDEALARMEKGDYGVCDECGENIAEKRLQIQPFSIHCVECQEEIEMSARLEN